MLTSPNRPYDSVVAAMGVTVNAVRMMVKRNNVSEQQDPTPPATPSQSPTPPAIPPVFDNFTIGAIRRHVHAKFVNKQYYTIQSLTEDLQMAGIIPWGISETAV